MIVKKSNIYQFKITLKGVNPPIWRRFQISEEETLFRMSATLITVMGWHGGHLHQYRVGDKFYGIPDDEFESEFEMIDERKIILKDLIKKGIKQIDFEYDFGDGWDHSVVFEGVVEEERDFVYPRCVKGKRSCPPEDCGGIWGYEDFLKAISDVNHPEHMQMLEWIGGAFDPEFFDLQDFSNLPKEAMLMEKEWIRMIE